MKRTVLSLVLIFAIVSLFTSPVSAGEPGSYKFEGKGYFYYLHDMSEGDGQSNSFDLARMYMGVKHYVSDDFTIRFLTDIGHQPGGGKFEVFAKYAYLDWKLSDKTNLLMGLQGTNNWSMPEKAWGYRQILWSPMEAFGKFWGGAAGDYQDYIDAWASTDATKAGAAANFKTARATKMGSSADLGIGIKMKPMDGGYVNLMIRNGDGYKKAENDMFKNFQVRTGHYFMDKAVHISVGIELEPWKGVEDAGASKGYTNLQWDVMGSYSMGKSMLVGVNANSKTFAGIEDITAMCVSVFGHGFIKPDKLKAIARYDIYTTGFNDAEMAPGDAAMKSDGGRILIGLDYFADKKIHIIPNFQMITYEDSDMDSNNSVYVHVYFKL